MKKILLATALFSYYRMCSTIYCSKQTGGRRAKPSPIISSFLELGRRKLSMQPKFVAAQKMLLKRSQQTFVKWLRRFFITLGIYTPLEARVYYTIIA